jgi:arginine/ornithine N-succinyltransferase beta subunit
VKKYLSLAAVAGILALLLFAYCSGKSAGSVKADDKELQHRVERAEKAFKIAIQSADREKKRGDSLAKKAAIVHTKYITKRDSLTITDTVEVKEFVVVADSTIAAKDSVIASQSRQIFHLRQGLDWKQEEINALNKRLALTSKRVRNAHKNGALIGAGAAVFAVLAVKASR